METITTLATSTDAKVQHLTKKSSKELLNKFADESLKKKKLELGVIKRQKKSRGMREDQCDSYSNGGAAVVERRSLLPAAMTRRSVLLRQLRARDVRNKSLLGTIQKTWHRTVEGASRVFMEKHYHRHKRLINDNV
ncbi:hypothetical protein Lal_00036330 [Lupinus albus]|uniref:Uncharacterized protein n=1 Tax=Lupinus albus TaxID=3870 RepID=A0A6A4NP41_LUPAL|nr:hypothetical protein Lalb_Chr18g0047871 [Lupinus albus]KAF1891979.1 hypothetical protein Lal_00036330 [Lupinus albus]